MNIQLSKNITFVPEFNGNKTATEAEQIIVTLRNPSMATKQKLAPHTTSKAVTNLKGQIDHMEVDIESDDASVLREMLISVTNCSYQYDGDEKKFIKCAADFANAPVDYDGLRKEIVGKALEILNKADIDEKN
jgi:hypothetical protein